ncbi:MAG: cysteine--tRNA ligase [Proteobacteria bacterium]|nr:cysteine--tRNA ligase [Pseudomonadota bacterium]MBU4471990.1 cysteine--tRNA ligase [Pseudomonadota bacterium]MCG2753458.1 cysteine--tRNA ligase [Desulfobacteraceae bacterium]
MKSSILETIGNTPLVKIHRLFSKPGVEIFAKPEYFNPGGSIKDRAALKMIEEGEKSGKLTKDKTVIEATSGNTGIGLALVCAVKGYKLLCVMSEYASMERQKILKARGADILLTPGHLGTDGAIEEVYRLNRENPEAYFMTDQFNNDANWRAHFEGTSKEIWDQTEGRITCLVATLGTSGTVMGLSRGLKAFNPAIQIVAVEPYLGHKIQGLKNMKEAYVPEIYDKSIIDVKVNVEDEKAYDMARRLAKEEGLLVGMSSGAAMVEALNQAEQMTEGFIVVILPDGGERYLSTPLFDVKETVGLTLFNTMGRTKEMFVPAKPGTVSMYSCGPTAHDRMTLGECRRFVFSDLLVRYLEYRGFSVKHVMNITDLDDKTIEGSEKAGMDLAAFTQKHIDAFMEDAALLGIKKADHYPRAGDHVEDMAALAEKLVQKGFAYEKLRSLYFDISRFSRYGYLSNVDLNKIRLGATVDLDEYEKDNPRDFTLFKRAKLSELRRGIFASTQWGNVRPSWHIQCAAMAMKYLGETYDIHASSRELVFPHHENEIAISQAVTGKTPAKYWVHCDRVLVDGKKMDEEEARITLPDLLALGFTGKEIRFWLVSAHYRKTITFSVERLENARRGLNRIDRLIQSLMRVEGNRPSHPETDQLLYDIRNGFVSAMDDDLNIANALAAIYKSMHRINQLVADNGLNPGDAGKMVDAFRQIDGVLQVMDFNPKPEDPVVQALILQREIAREEKNWALADRIREQLTAQGILLQDKK